MERACSSSSGSYPVFPISVPPKRTSEQKHGFSVALSMQRKLAKIQCLEARSLSGQAGIIFSAEAQACPVSSRKRFASFDVRCPDSGADELGASMSEDKGFPFSLRLHVVESSAVLPDALCVPNNTNPVSPALLAGSLLSSPCGGQGNLFQHLVSVDTSGTPALGQVLGREGSGIWLSDGR